MMSRYNPFANSLLSMSKLMHVSAAPPGHSAKCFTRTPASKPGRLGQTQATPRQLSASACRQSLGSHLLLPSSKPSSCHAAVDFHKESQLDPVAAGSSPFLSARVIESTLPALIRGRQLCTANFGRFKNISCGRQAHCGPTCIRTLE